VKNLGRGQIEQLKPYNKIKVHFTKGHMDEGNIKARTPLTFDYDAPFEGAVRVAENSKLVGMRLRDPDIIQERLELWTPENTTGGD
jgi:hypothetical protein